MPDQKAEAPLTGMPAFDRDVAAQVTRAIEANMAAGRKWVEGCGRISRELMTFSMTRLERDMETAKKLSTCEDPGEVVRIQTDSLNGLVHQFAEEARTLGEIVDQTTASCLETLTGASGETETEAATSSPSGQAAQKSQA